MRETSLSPLRCRVARVVTTSGKLPRPGASGLTSCAGTGLTFAQCLAHPGRSPGTKPKPGREAWQIYPIGDQMVIQTLYGFVVTDVIFGVLSVVVIGLCDITAHGACVFAESCSPLRRSINAAKSSAPAIGAGKRALSTILSERHNIARKALIKTRLAIDRLC